MSYAMPIRSDWQFNTRRASYELSFEAWSVSRENNVPDRQRQFFLCWRLLTGPTSAQTPHKIDASNDVRNSAPTSVQLELVRTETGFFEAWKTLDQAYFREHMPDNGIFWSDKGTLSRDQQLAELQDFGENLHRGWLRSLRFRSAPIGRRHILAHLQSRAVRYLQRRENAGPPERQFDLHPQSRPLAGHLPGVKFQ